MIVNSDLHIHGKYSIGSSKNMNFPLLSLEAKKKGISLVATGDCLHSKWLSEIKQMEEVEEGTYEQDGTRFILTCEVEDNKRVHHLLLFPSMSSALDFRMRVSSHSKNIDSDGRPNLRLSGEEIAQHAKDVSAQIGPCHAFTPWTALYASFDSLRSCYGDCTDYISFIELGLSADTDYADRIGELQNLTFLTNSDAHSPNPSRLAREFTRFELKDVTFSELKMALLRKKGRKPVLNVGLPPQEGKYNESACINCFTHYSLTEAVMNKWKCTKCKKRIKKGVLDRINELATYETPQHPAHRPPYLHLIPLTEIIKNALGHSSTGTKKVREAWESLVMTFGSEVSVLVDAKMDKIQKATDGKIKDSIQAFREGRVLLHPGGGGMYGSLEILNQADFARLKNAEKKQKPGQMSLLEY